MEVTFFAPGHPRPKGSMKHVGGGRMVESSKHSAPWRKTVATYARRAAPQVPIEGAVQAAITFVTPRPKSVKRAHPMTRSSGDLDKLTRLVFDALVDAGVMTDDSQVVHATVRKIYPTSAYPDSGAYVVVLPVEDVA